MTKWKTNWIGGFCNSSEALAWPLSGGGGKNKGTHLRDTQQVKSGGLHDALDMKDDIIRQEYQECFLPCKINKWQFHF